MYIQLKVTGLFRNPNRHVVQKPTSSDLKYCACLYLGINAGTDLVNYRKEIA